MINDDTLVKYSIERLNSGYKPFAKVDNWVDYTKMLFRQIREIRDKEFTALGLDDMKIIKNTDIKVGMRIILCDFLDNNCGNIHTTNASVLGIITRINPENPFIVELEIEGLGHRNDSERDPHRILTWGKKIYPDLRAYPTLIELTTKPKADGGNVYYFFNKSTRDLRENYIPGDPNKSTELIVYSIINMSNRCIENLRERAQYFHYFRRVFKEICKVLEENPENEIMNKLYGLFKDNPYPTNKDCINLSEKLLKLLSENGY